MIAVKRKRSTDQKQDDFDSQVLSKIGEKLYLKTEKADVYFTFNTSDERIPAHKLLLYSGSDVFHAMFYGSLKEEGDIRIVDASAEAFKDFLRFFYFNEVKPSIENVAEVMYLGNKYNVEECLRLCSELLTTNITNENVVSAFALAVTYDQMQLKTVCESEISSNSKEIFKSSSFMECGRQVLDRILHMDRLSCSETEVFEACMSWVRLASKQEQLTRDIIQTHLGDSFYAIQFGSMYMDDFVKLLPKYGDLFSGAEYNEIFQLISKQVNQPKLFKGCCRSRFVWDEKNVIRCNRFEKLFRLEKHSYHVQSEEITRFSTNKTLLLGNFVCAPLFNDEDDKVETAKMIATIHTNFNRTQTQFSFDYVYDSDGFIVKLPEPILVQPGIMYEIRLTIPSTVCYACRQLKPAVNLKNDIVLQFHNDRKVDNKIAGVIFELGFNLLE